MESSCPILASTQLLPPFLHPALSLLPQSPVGQESSQCGSVTIPGGPSRTGHNVQGRAEADHKQFLLPANTWPKAKPWSLICERWLSKTCSGLAWPPGRANSGGHILLVSSVPSFCSASRVGLVIPAFHPRWHMALLLCHLGMT